MVSDPTWDMRQPLVRLDIVWRCGALTYGKTRLCVASMQLRARRGIRVGKACVPSWCMAYLIALALCMAAVDSMCYATTVYCAVMCRVVQ